MPWDILTCYWQNFTTVAHGRQNTFAVQKQKNKIVMKSSFGKKVMAVILGISIVVLIVMSVRRDDLLIMGVNMETTKH